ncbi:MAG: GNAT family N-acetyltransferase, partial [Campylobacterota bacterium]|nr:GNAT family N-acetyltransferase [Campylobacterota bacterium]
KIVKDMVKFAYPSDMENLNIFTDFYGLTKKDLGLYALVDNCIAGAIWSRELNENFETPTLSVAILPEFKGKEIGSFMMNQFLQEAGAIYEQISIDITHKPKAILFYEKFGFEKLDDSDSLIMIKKLEKKEVLRPSDGYDSSYWIE